ncbi:MAG: hypothetical protein J6Y43_06270 [Clostridia bacterium]|nr:hypothetical protein [Clostridia bacterium]
MKRTFKRMVAFFACFALALTPLALVGCGGDGTMTDAELNDLMANAAESFYSDHNTAENYSDTTFHWLETETNKETVKLTYKQSATDEQPIEGTFENRTEETIDTKVALKKSGDTVVAQVEIVNTTTEKSYDVKDDDTLDEINSTVITTKTYRLFTYLQDEETKNILLYVETEKIDDGEVQTVAKKYGEKGDIAAYSEFIKNYMLRYTNKNIARTFFEYGEILLLYKAMIVSEKDGDEVKLSIGYDNLPDVDYDENYEYSVSRISSKTDIFYKDGKVWKAKNYMKHIGKTFYSENSLAFDCSASATVDTSIPDLTDYEGPTNTVYSNNYDYSLQYVMEELPYGGLF